MPRMFTLYIYIYIHEPTRHKTAQSSPRTLILLLPRGRGENLKRGSFLII